MTFSGCPGDSETSRYPNWVTCPWPDDFLKILDWQWNEKVIPYWKKTGAFAKEHGVKIATENMWCWDNEKDQACTAACSHHDDFRAHIDAVNDPFLVACLDIGHAEMKGLDTTAVRMIHTLGSSLQALHIHDNDMWHDSHQIPFSMNIDFEPIVRALKDIDYQGYFTLEADSYLKKFSPDEMEKGIKDLYASAKRLKDMFEAL